MRWKFSLFLIFIGSTTLQAQLPEDALRMSWAVPSGTARQQAIGGAMGSLGGEISTLFVNPAGLGFYKTNEFVMSPGLNLAGGKGSFRGSDAKADMLSRFNYGTTGFVWGYADPYSRWSGKAFGLAVNRVANFNSSSYYQGQNDYSSFSEPLANEFFNYYAQRKGNNPGLSNSQIIDDALNEPSMSLLTKMGLYTYLVDIDTSNGQNTVISRAELAGIVNQSQRTSSSGGVTEISLGYAANMDDKIYIGGSIGVPIVNYERRTEFREEDANGAGNNEFLFSQYNETYSSKGAGINARLGIIIKPAKQVRLGIAIHSPTLYGLKDQLSSDMTTDIDTATGSVKQFTANSSDFYGGSDPEFRYDLQTPWKFILSGSYVLHEVADINQQKGFITADIEYVSHKGSRFSSTDNTDDSYFKDLNEAVKASYKGSFNVRLGGELKFKTLMTRLGFAYYGNPYNDAALKARRMNISGGLGYRNKGIFLDLTYVHSLIRDVNFPYRVDPPRQNTYAELRDYLGSVVATIGIKF